MALPPAVRTEGLTRLFGGRTAIRDVSLDIPKGSIYGLLGPNGAGKTTTLKVLLGLIRPTAGSVYFHGRPPDRGQFREVGSLIETPSLYEHLTGEENLEIACMLRAVPRGEVHVALSAVHLVEDGRRPVREYSLGMKQRLGVALALLANPHLVILDEPTNGFDPIANLAFRELLKNRRTQGATTILSSHVLNEVEQLATHVGILCRGDLVFQGTVEDLRCRGGQTLIIGVERPEEAARLLTRMGLAPRHENGRLKIVSQIGAARINRQLQDAGFDVYHLSTEDPTLEASFLGIVERAE